MWPLVPRVLFCRHRVFYKFCCRLINVCSIVYRLHQRFCSSRHWREIEFELLYENIFNLLRDCMVVTNKPVAFSVSVHTDADSSAAESVQLSRLLFIMSVDEWDYLKNR